MAAGKWNMQKASGGVASITVADGVSNTAVVLPESGTVATTDNIVGFKNYIINGNFNVWQRGTSFSGLINGTYSADRWVVYDSTSDINYSIIRNTGIFQGGYGASYTWNSGTGYRSIIQFIENVTKFKVGAQFTISFEAYTNSAPYDISVGLQGVRGTWSSATSVTMSKVSLTNSKTKYSVTLTVPDWSGLGIDWSKLEDTKLALKFDFPSTTNGSNFIFSNVQLEEGSVATPFEQRPYGLELSLCQRYYQRGFQGRGVASAYNIGYVSLRIPLHTSMRVIPTISQVQGTTLNVAIEVIGIGPVTPANMNFGTSRPNAIQVDFGYTSLKNKIDPVTLDQDIIQCSAEL